MNTITQRLREIAKVLAEDAAARRGIGLDKAAELYSMAAELEAPATDPLPVAWIRWRSDGGYEGPLMHDQMEDVRKRSGAWTPLYRHPPTEVAALQEQINTAKPLDDPRLQDIYGCAIDGALTIGYQGGAAAANGHWLKPWWEKGRAVAEREAALQAEIAQLQQSRDTYFAERNSARDAYMKHRKIGDELQARINALEARQVPDGTVPISQQKLAELIQEGFMAGAKRGIETAVTDMLAKGWTAPQSSQQDSSKERP